MPWGKVDDAHYDHAKVLALPRAIRNAADGLYWRVISRCNRTLSDGWISPADLEVCDATDELVEALVTVGLWERRGDRLRVHDYLVHNKSKREVLAERQKKADAGRAGGLASGRARAVKAARKPRQEHPSEPVRTPLKHERSNGEARASNVVELPTRPVRSLTGTGRVADAPPPAPPAGGGGASLREHGVLPPPGYREPSRHRPPADDELLEQSRAILADPRSSEANRIAAREALLGLGVRDEVPVPAGVGPEG